MTLFVAFTANTTSSQAHSVVLYVQQHVLQQLLQVFWTGGHP
jgi:hypothetical protein